MNEKPLLRFGFQSGNLKSVIQNPKWLGLSIMALVLVAAGATAQAQQAKKFVRIGYLAHTGRPATAGAFVEGLRDLGYAEGQNIAIEYRWAEGKYERLPELAIDLVRSKVELIVAVGGTEVVQAAQQATRTTPIVFVIADDPVEVGLVSNIARPAGNITGISSMNAELDAKRLELLKHAIPSLTHAALLYNPVDPGTSAMLKATQAAARVMKVQLQTLEARGSDGIERAFGMATKSRAGGLTVLGSPTFFQYYLRLAELSVKHRFPMVAAWRQVAEAGGLMSYGVNIADMFRRAASYVDRILKGAKAGELPVERPVKFELFINLKTAKQMDLTIPPTVLAQADKVIR